MIRVLSELDAPGWVVFPCLVVVTATTVLVCLRGCLKAASGVLRDLIELRATWRRLRSLSDPSRPALGPASPDDANRQLTSNKGRAV